MAAPTAPTVTTLTTDALKDCGYSSPTSAQLTRAAEFVEQIKNDIMQLSGGRKLKSLHTSSVLVTANGQGRYSNPTDYYSDLSLEAIHGNTIGTAAGGAVGSVTLASGHGLSEIDIIGKDVLIYAGTGKASLSQITGLSGDVASVTPNFTTAPTSGSSYMIIGNYRPLEEAVSWDYDRLHDKAINGVPTHWVPIGDADYGEFILYPIPYNASAPYGLRMRYYANLMTLDLTGTLMATLYQRWRNLWVEGVKAKQLFEDDDSRWQIAESKYRSQLQGIVMHETYGMNLSNLQSKVVDC